MVSDKKKDTIERIDRHISDIISKIDNYNPNVICKEEPFVGRSATAQNLSLIHI